MPREIWGKMAEMDYFKIHVPETLGGLGLDFCYTVVFLEELNKCNSAGFAASIGAHAFLAMPHLIEEGSDYLQDTYLKPASNGEKIIYKKIYFKVNREQAKFFI